MKRLVTIVCVDEGRDFCLKYYWDENGSLSVDEEKVKKVKPVLKSLSKEFLSAEYYEREIHEFFGVVFEGNARLEEHLFLPDKGVPKYPLRKGD